MEKRRDSSDAGLESDTNSHTQGLAADTNSGYRRGKGDFRAFTSGQEEAKGQNMDASREQEKIRHEGNDSHQQERSRHRDHESNYKHSRGRGKDRESYRDHRDYVRDRRSELDTDRGRGRLPDHERDAFQQPATGVNGQVESRHESDHRDQALGDRRAASGNAESSDHSRKFDRSSRYEASPYEKREAYNAKESSGKRQRGRSEDYEVQNKRSIEDEHRRRSFGKNLTGGDRALAELGQTLSGKVVTENSKLTEDDSGRPNNRGEDIVADHSRGNFRDRKRPLEQQEGYRRRQDRSGSHHRDEWRSPPGRVRDGRDMLDSQGRPARDQESRGPEAMSRRTEDTPMYDVNSERNGHGQSGSPNARGLQHHRIDAEDIQAALGVIPPPPKSRFTKQEEFVTRYDSPPQARPARDIDDFERIKQIGEGTYGQVWSARDLKTNDIVALKKIRLEFEKDGFPFTAVREVKLLQMLPYHPNIVNLKEMVTSSSKRSGTPENMSDQTSLKSPGLSKWEEETLEAATSGATLVAAGTDTGAGTTACNSRPSTGGEDIYMVFEYVDHDLAGLMQSGIVFTLAQVKCCVKQLLEGLAHIHAHSILHRDIKGSNLLVDNDGLFKIADFGLAREVLSEDRKYTNRVVTLWYRSPELLLGANKYDASVDMWSVGCLVTEMITQKALFPGNTELDQIDLIHRRLGTPSDDEWPEFKRLPMSESVQRARYPGRKKELLGDQSDDTRAFVLNLLEMNPKKRMTAAQALKHRWFSCAPLPSERLSLDQYESSHEFEAKKRRVAAREAASSGAEAGTRGKPSARG